MQTILDLIFIQFILVFIIDISGFIPSLKLFISKYLTKSKIVTDNFSIKPIDCSLCMTHWVGLIYIIYTGFNLPLYAMVCILSAGTGITYKAILNIKDKLQ